VVCCGFPKGGREDQALIIDLHLPGMNGLQLQSYQPSQAAAFLSFSSPLTTTRKLKRLIVVN